MTVTDEQLDKFARELIERLNNIMDGDERRKLKTIYKKGFRDGYEEGVKNATKELLAR